MSDKDRLKKISNKSVAGPDFVIMVPNVHELHYAEKEQVYKVEIEGGTTNEQGHVEWLVYGDSLTVIYPPHQCDSFSWEEKQRMLKNISDSLTLLNMPHEIVSNSA